MSQSRQSDRAAQAILARFRPLVLYRSSDQLLRILNGKTWMHLRYGILADAVTPGGGAKKNIIGTFDIIFARKFPARHRRLAIILRLEAHVTEAGSHTLKIDFVDADYRIIGSPPEMPFEIRQEGRHVPDAPLSAEVVFEIEGLTFGAAGSYEFAVKVDGRHIGSVPLYVRSQQPEQP